MCKPSVVKRKSDILTKTPFERKARSRRNVNWIWRENPDETASNLAGKSGCQSQWGKFYENAPVLEETWVKSTLERTKPGINFFWRLQWNAIGRRGRRSKRNKKMNLAQKTMHPTSRPSNLRDIVGGTVTTLRILENTTLQESKFVAVAGDKLRK